MTLYTEIRRRLFQATGDSKYSLDQEECTTFILSTNKKAAITVSPHTRSTACSDNIVKEENLVYFAITTSLCAKFGFAIILLKYEGFPSQT